MTKPTACQSRCTFHTKRDVHIPCRMCQSRHATTIVVEDHGGYLVVADRG